MNINHEQVLPGQQFDLVVEPVTAMQLVKYAGASDDYNGIHYDLASAEAAGLGGIIAHGMLTMGFMGRAVSGWSGPAARIRHIAARFTSPVRPGDVVKVTGTVTARHAQGDVIRIECALLASVGDKAVASGDAVVEWASAR